MYKIIFILLCALSITSCSRLPVYRPPIQQGNVITQDTLSKVHLGMNRAQVENIMGTPVLRNLFEHDRMVYIYTFKPYSVRPSGSKMSVKRVTLTFHKNRLIKIEK